MKFKDFLLILIISIAYWMISFMLIEMVSAQDFCTTNQSYEIIETCFVCEGCGQYCSSSAECNLTVKNPLRTIIVNNELMTNQISFHNLTITGDLTNQSGRYNYVMACNDGNSNGSFHGSFTCNPPGIEPTESRTQSITRSIYLFFFLGILLIVGGFITKRKLAPIKWSLYILGAISILVSINLISVSLRDEVVNPNIVNLFDTITAATFYLYWFAAALIFIIWILSILFTLQKMVERRKIERFG